MTQRSTRRFVRGPRAMAAAVAACMAAIAAASAQAQCPSPGDCRKPHGGTGCEMPQCCEIVCAVNPLCCELAWDQGCADLAIEECEGINCPADGACDAAHPSPGCADFECCDFVTTIDPWCSFASWDEICAREAERYCGVPRCELAPPSAPPIDEAEPCYERFNDGWATGFPPGRIAVGCGDRFQGRIVSGGPRDTDWFVVDATAWRRVRARVEAEFPVELQLVLGGADGPNEVRWLSAAGLCEGERAANFLVPPGVASLVLGAGDEDRPWRRALECDEIDPDAPAPDPDDPPPLQVHGLRWRVSFDCLPIGDLDGDGAVTAADLGALLNAWGEVDPAAPIDPLGIDADLDGDGTVGASDLAALLSGW
jgi:hypothetical protein